MNHIYIYPYSHILIVNLVELVQTTNLLLASWSSPLTWPSPPREDIFTPPSHSSPRGIQQLRTTSWCGLSCGLSYGNIKYATGYSLSYGNIKYTTLYNYTMWKGVKYGQSMSKPFGDTEKYLGPKYRASAARKIVRTTSVLGKRGNFKKIWPVEREEKLEKHVPSF